MMQDFVNHLIKLRQREKIPLEFLDEIKSNIKQMQEDIDDITKQIKRKSQELMATRLPMDLFKHIDLADEEKLKSNSLF